MNLRFTLVVLMAAACGIIALVVLFIYNIFVFASQKADQQRLVQLNKENKIIRSEILKMKEKTADLNHLMDSLEAYDERLRTYASLDPINEDVRKMGVGGNEPDHYQKISVDTREDLIALSQLLDNLLARSRLQATSFTELVGHLETKEYLRDHTPSIIPVQGWFISGFGYRIDPFTGKVKMHQGLDIAAPPGTPIIAPANGRVIFVGERLGFGLTLEIDHGYGFSSLYAHCQRIRYTEQDVALNTRVARGDIIAYVGTTGKTTGPHLHYEVHVSNVPVDPLDYILTVSEED
jgi:murein DD-endopeptidase MepM/ murein hydrolase activator NlpD